MTAIGTADYFLIPAGASNQIRHSVNSDLAVPTKMITVNQQSTDSTNHEPLCNNPAKEAALQALCKTTGYALKQENGQRKYGGPPPNWTDAIPGKGCEIFVGKLPRDLYEDELVPVLEKCGRIFELRLMMDFNGNNRGFAFVKYCAQNDARRALKELNNYEIRKGRLLGVCKSVDNCRLFVGGIPKTKTKEEILTEMQKITEGVVDAIVYPSAADKNKNRGFAFVEYQDHHTAAMARRKLMHTRPQVWGHPIAVDWAEPEVEVDDDVMATVKILYVRNLMLNTTEEQLEKEFTALVPPGAIERVKKIRDYGFVHFNKRENALKCMHALNGKLLDGAPMEVTLAKPVDRETYVRYTRAANRVPSETPETFAAAYPGFIATTYDPRLDPATAAATAYTFPGAPIYYGGVPYAATTIPTIPQNPRYSVPSTLQTIGIPQIGAAGVPLGIPGATTGGTGTQGRGISLRGRNRGIARGVGARNLLNLGRGGFQTTYYNHYRRPQWPQQYQGVSAQRQGQGEKYDLQPGMELTPINPLSLKHSNPQKSSIQLLEEYCMKEGLGMPDYKPHSAVGLNGRQLYLYRVELQSSDSSKSPGECSPHKSPSPSQYTPTKLCTSLESAKEVAASHVLGVLNADNSVYVADDITRGVAAISMGGAEVNGYQTPVYNPDSGYLNGYPVFGAVSYPSASEAYAHY